MSSNKTKAELVEENRLLKTKAKELIAEIKELKSAKAGEVGSDPYMSLGVYKDGKQYRLVRIAFDPETQASQVVSDELASKVPEAPHLAKMNAEEILFMEMFARLENR